MTSLFGVVLFFSLLAAIAAGGRALYKRAVAQRGEPSADDPQGIGDEWQDNKCVMTDEEFVKYAELEEAIRKTPVDSMFCGMTFSKETFGEDIVLFTKLLKKHNPHIAKVAEVRGGKSWVIVGMQQVGVAELMARRWQEAKEAEEERKRQKEEDARKYEALRERERLAKAAGVSETPHVTAEDRFNERRITELEAQLEREKKNNYLRKLYHEKSDKDLLKTIQTLNKMVSPTNPHLVAAIQEAEARDPQRIAAFRDINETGSVQLFSENNEPGLATAIKQAVVAEDATARKEVNDYVLNKALEQPSQDVKDVIKDVFPEDVAKIPLGDLPPELQEKKQKRKRMAKKPVKSKKGRA